MGAPGLTGLSWRKSSYSGSDENCVEVAFLPTKWHKSTRSGSSENCVEVGFVPGAVAVRDSKDKQGPVLAFAAPAFASFLTSAKAGRLG
ncbi:DUF397 domain-containing protein [Saccharopolyspora erythraea]|uniref:DUF397 domain-containing protein n=1 Tax=Saccharopolyspora erythraea TaxID=1836 RepID=UPI001BA501CF|nr:DUF397 domain-containing protein [Saccharopolyspora erythraea]QUH04376.1 DUF397 domain-containing protein [Saccharopolyspora erythraea]